MSLSQGTVTDITIPGPGPFGFRLAGGKDFGLPLHISKITAGGKAQRANLREKDVILMINGQDIATCTHLDAQNKIKASFHDDLHLRTQRGDSRVWNPVTRDDSGSYRVSLKANNDQEFLHPGSKSNFTAKGFGSPQAPPQPSSVTPPGGRGSAQVVHLQFNSPAGLYSEQNIAETFKGQTAGMIDNSVGNGDYQPQPYQPMRDTGYSAKPVAHQASPVSTRPVGMRSVKPPSSTRSPQPPSQQVADLPNCAVCESNIIGRFVRVMGLPMHEGCFNCRDCGISLRNKGYYNIDGRVYCKDHATARTQGRRPGGPSHTPTYSQPTQRSPQGYGSPQSYGGPQSYGSPASYAPPPPPPPPPVQSAPARIQMQIRPKFNQPQKENPNNLIIKALQDHPDSLETVKGIQPFFTVKNPTKHKLTSEVERERRGYQPPPSGPRKQAPSQVAANRPRAPQAAPYHQPSAPANRPRPPTQPKGADQYCDGCRQIIKGTVVTAVGRSWHPEHFVCAHCHDNLKDQGFVEHDNKLYCQADYSKLYAPKCFQCGRSVAGNCVTAMGRNYHPEHFVCYQCKQPIGDQQFMVNNGQPYCRKDHEALFSHRCASCNFTIDAGDPWVEAMDKCYHSNCFNCSICQTPLEGQKFYAKSGRPVCQTHAY